MEFTYKTIVIHINKKENNNNKMLRFQYKI